MSAIEKLDPAPAARVIDGKWFAVSPSTRAHAAKLHQLCLLCFAPKADVRMHYDVFATRAFVVLFYCESF